MSGTGISNATKAALIAAVTQGQRVEAWHFEFICRERDFCDEFVQAAEAVQNDQVLEDLKNLSEEKTAKAFLQKAQLRTLRNALSNCPIKSRTTDLRRNQ